MMTTIFNGNNDINDDDDYVDLLRWRQWWEHCENDGWMQLKN